MSFLRGILNIFHFNRTNWKAVTLCLVTALVFWFFNALNKNYATNIRLGVNFQFDQERFISVTPLPKEIYMNVSGNGWDLLRKSLGFNMPDVNIPLERPTEVRKIVGSTLPALLAGQLGNLQINHVVTDTLYISVDPKESRKVRVTVDPEQFSFAEGFGRLSPIVVLPDSVSLVGPKSVLAQIPFSIQLEIEEESIDKDFRRKVEVVLPGTERVIKDPANVEVIFEVVEWIQVTKRVKLKIENPPARARLSLVLDSVNCLFQIPKSQFQDFEQTIASQEAVIDLTSVRRGDNKLRPTITGLPINARLLQIDSVSVRLY